MGLLREAAVSWGHTTLIESDPGEEDCRSAIYVPFTPDVFFDRDPRWGIYHRDGRLVDAAAYYRGPDKRLIGQSPDTELDATALPFVDEELVYGGPVIAHYGHFITASLPRLWHLRAMAGSRLRILCHGHEPPDDWFGQEFIRAIFGAIGLTPESFAYIQTPSVIRRLWVPRPAMEEQNFVHRAFDELGTAIGRAYDVHREPQSDVRLYLSKTRLNEGINRFQDEILLEDCFARRGFEIIHPQEIPFAEQIKVLARAGVIAGTVGSALHTTLFLDRASRIVALTGSEIINSNIRLIDRLKSNEALYLCPAENALEREGEGGFNNTWAFDRASIFAEVAEEFAAAV